MRHPGRARTFGLAGLSGLVLAACGGSRPHPQVSPSTRRTTTTVAMAPTTVTTTLLITLTTPTLPPETPTGGEFTTPSGLRCAVDNGKPDATTPVSGVFCDSSSTMTEKEGVFLNSEGSLVLCAGQDCLTNAGLDAPTLSIDTAYEVGPFACLSIQQGVRCTIADGNGFDFYDTGKVRRLGTGSYSTETNPQGPATPVGVGDTDGS